MLNPKASLGIIGTGFVGKALLCKFVPQNNILSFDIKYGLRLNTPNREGYRAIDKPVDGVDNIFTQFTEICAGPVFICVPTPMQDDGSCDTTIVEDTVRKLAEANFEFPIIIKSTIPPGTTDKLQQKYNVDLYFSPEFLRAASATSDMVSLKHLIIGIPAENKKSSVKEIHAIYRKAYTHTPVLYETSAIAAEFSKYMINSYLAVKVSFANDIKNFCDTLAVDYTTVRSLVALDGRIESSYLQVPGPDGQAGFGGSCFPKDLNAIIKAAEERGLSMPTLWGAWKTNLQSRAVQDWE